MSTTLATVCLMAVAVEIAAAKWVVASTAGGKIRRVTLSQETPRERLEALVAEVSKARQLLKLSPEARAVVAYEAGQEGFWLVRALRARGIEADVIDPVSLKVDRRAKRVKTDRVDAEALAIALWRYINGDRHELRMVRVPSETAEDAREWERERNRLAAEARSCRDRIRKKLRTHGIWNLPEKRWRDDLRAGRLRTFAGTALGTQLQRALVIELDRLELVESKLKTLERDLDSLDAVTRERVEHLSRMRGIGAAGSRTLATLLFWREFANRRQVGACVGLTGTPYDSGTSRQDQGISKTGDPRLRALLVELSWLWVRLQPESRITRWFHERTQGAGKRGRRVMIVAVARKLAIALWRYLKFGEIPDGARLKPAA